MFIIIILDLQDTLVIKTPKKSPLILRMVVPLFAMVCGVYICSICLKQINTHTKAKFLNIKVIDHENSCPFSNSIYIRYPQPQTFRRYSYINQIAINASYLGFFLFLVIIKLRFYYTLQGRMWLQPCTVLCHIVNAEIREWMVWDFVE